jgi:hypothetical protein
LIPETTMTGQTPHLGIAYLAAEQAQKHVTVNEALARLDALVHLTVKSRVIGMPPASTQEGDRYIIPSAATGAWTGHQDKIALWSGGDWIFINPSAGFQAWVKDESKLYIHDGTAWMLQTVSLQNLPLLGVGTAADSSNPFSAQLNSALWTALPIASGGTGDLRYVLNKQASANTLSMLFQSGYSARAEAGLVGNDRFTLKVSPDGSAWHNAVVIDNAGGQLGIAGNPSGADAVQVFGNGMVSTAPGIGFYRTGGTTTGRVGLDYATGLNHVLTNTAGAVSYFYEAQPAAGAGAIISYFRYSNITGACYFNVNKGDNTSATSARLSGGTGNSFINALGGNFGVGTGSPVDRLAVAGNIVPQSDNAYSCGKSGYRFTEIWAVTGTIQTSDARLKTAIADTPLGLDFINRLRPVSYRWRAASNIVERVVIEVGEEDIDTGETDEDGNPVPHKGPVTSETDIVTGQREGKRTHHGLIAQEVKAALDAMGCGDFAGYIKTDLDDTDSEEGLRYDQFIAPLIKAVQELSAKVEALEAEKPLRRRKPPDELVA